MNFRLDKKIKTEYPDELELLFFCSKPTLTVNEKNTLENYLSEKDIDWEIFIRLVQDLKVIGFVYKNLKGLPSLLNPEALSRLKEINQRNVFKNLNDFKEMSDILNIFHTENIDVIPLKGLLLSQELYGDLITRKMIDIDFLLQKEKIKAAVDVLKKRGYKIIDEQEGFMLSYEKETAMINPEDIKIELHWRLFDNRYASSMTFEKLWMSKETITVGGQIFPFLPKEYLLLYLCAHGSRHRWTKLSDLIDIYTLIQKHNDWDWELVWKKAKEFNLHNTLMLGVFFLADFYQCEIPPYLKKRIGRWWALPSMTGYIKGYSYIDPFTFHLEKDKKSVQWQFYKIWYFLNLHASFSYKKETLKYFLIPKGEDKLYQSLPALIAIPLRFLNRLFQLIYRYLFRVKE